LEVANIRIDKDDESGKTDLYGRTLPFIDQVALCFAGMEAQNIWQHPSAHMAGAGDYADFCWLVKWLSEEHGDALYNAGRKRANEVLQDNRMAVEIVAQRLVQQGYMTATEFKHLTGTLEPGPC
jgi:hypothetical protein